MTRRFAVYFCPTEDSDLYRFGSWWLGRDCRSIELAPPPDCGLADVEWRRVTASPRHYGFHATLKPPFALRDGCTRVALVEALAALAAGQAAFNAPALQLVQHEGFLALTPAAECSALTTLAAAAVVEIDAFRRPASPAELARRRSTGLTPHQDTLLTRWGYPYVLDQFRFHMTLTERLSADERYCIWPILGSKATAFSAEPLSFVDLCLFEQVDADVPFVLTQRFPFG